MSYQGYDYATVLIGEQCWFAENLRSEDYTNGDSINFVIDPYLWTIVVDQQGNGLNGVGTVTCMHRNTNPCSNGLDPSVCETEGYYLNTYGYLYNGPAVLDPRGLCPSGWHVATDDDFKLLESTLGMPETELDNFGFRGEGVGHFIKSADLWFWKWLGPFGDAVGTTAPGGLESRGDISMQAAATKMQEVLVSGGLLHL